MASTKAIAAIALTLVIACPLALGYAFSFDEEEITGWETTDQFNISDMLLNSSTEYFQTYTGPNNNEVVGSTYVTVGSTVTSLPVYESDSIPVTLNSTYQTIPNYIRYTVGVAQGPVAYKVTQTDGTVTEGLISLQESGSFSKSLNGTLRIVTTNNTLGTKDIVEIPNLQSLQMKHNASGSKSVAFTAWEATGQYADASDGWYPVGSYGGWDNGFHNNSVTFSIHFTEASSLRLYMSEMGGVLWLQYDGTTLSYGPSALDLTALGHYSSIRVTVTPENYLVKGLQVWPPLGSAATTYNSGEVEHAPVGSIDTVTFDGFGSSVVVIRCDSAEIPAGSYPSTKDYTLGLSDLFPNTMMSLRLNSIGVYGDNLTIGGYTFDVENGRISVDGRTVPLRGAMLSFLPDGEGMLTGSIGGREIGTFAALPSITFGGEWSLTATAYKVEETTDVSTEWHPGGFGLDKDGLIAAGLLTCCGVFVLLGMYGRASGTKVGFLGVICGGAAIIYFMLI